MPYSCWPGVGGPRQLEPLVPDAPPGARAEVDGKLSKDEWLAILPEQAKPMADQMWSARVDADGDGFITKEQFLALRMGPRPGGN